MSALKAVLALSLYPQIAIPDEGNDRRKESEAIFNTNEQTGINIHPSSALFRLDNLLS